MFGGRDTPGRRKTTMCEYASAGSAYISEVVVGADDGAVIGGWPVGIMPNS